MFLTAFSHAHTSRVIVPATAFYDSRPLQRAL